MVMVSSHTIIHLHVTFHRGAHDQISGAGVRVEWRQYANMMCILHTVAGGLSTQACLISLTATFSIVIIM